MPTEFGGIFGLTADMHACRLIQQYVLKERDQLIRSKTVLHAIEATVGTWLPVRLVATEEGKSDDHDLDNKLFDAQSLQQAKESCLAKIRQLTVKGELIGTRMSYYLFRWLEWGGKDEPSKWAVEVSSSLEGALSFLEGFVGQVHVSSGRGNHVHFVLDISNVGIFVDLDQIWKTISPVCAQPVPSEFSMLAEKYQRTIQATKTAYEQRASEGVE